MTDDQFNEVRGSILRILIAVMLAPAVGTIFLYLLVLLASGIRGR